MGQGRDSYFDALRGIAIILVVAIHTFTASFSGFLDFAGLVRNACNPAVPFFIAISGYFYTQKGVSSAASYKQTLTRQLKYVYIPTLIWSIPYFALDIYSHGLSLWPVLMLFCCGYSIYYFIAVIFQFYILGPAIKISKVTLVASCIATFTSIAVVTYFVSVRGLNLPLFVYASPFILWLAFWCLGAYCSKHEISLPLISLLILAVICLFLSQYETSLLYPLHGAGFGIKPSSHLFAFVLICILFSEQAKALFHRLNPVIRTCLSYLGRVSFGIYLIHLHLARHFLYYMPNSWIVRLLFLILASILFIELMRLPLKSKAKYLGIR